MKKIFLLFSVLLSCVIMNASEPEKVVTPFFMQNAATVNSGQIIGYVFDKNTNIPISGCEIKLVAVYSYNPNVPPSVSYNYTNGTGSFLFNVGLKPDGSLPDFGLYINGVPLDSCIKTLDYLGNTFVYHIYI